MDSHLSPRPPNTTKRSNFTDVQTITQRDQGAKCHAVGTGEGFELGQSGFPSQDQGWGKVLSDETAQKELLGIPPWTQSHRAAPGNGSARRDGTLLLALENHLSGFDDYNHPAGSGVMVNVNSLLLEKKNKSSDRHSVHSAP